MSVALAMEVVSRVEEGCGQKIPAGADEGQSGGLPGFGRIAGSPSGASPRRTLSGRLKGLEDQACIEINEGDGWRAQAQTLPRTGRGQHEAEPRLANPIELKAR